jgi:hypothetical protein
MSSSNPPPIICTLVHKELGVTSIVHPSALIFVDFAMDVSVAQVRTTERVI